MPPLFLHDKVIENPFTSVLALKHTNYLQLNEERGIISQSRNSAAKADENIFRLIQELIGNDTFPCLAAKASLNTRSYRVGVYSGLEGDGKPGTGT